MWIALAPLCLNPYSIGIWSATMFLSRLLTYSQCVLILILLEYGLRQTNVVALTSFPGVLILILLEYGLRHPRDTAKQVESLLVLILILLEYGLRPDGKKQEVYFCEVLILILLEYGLRLCGVGSSG